MRTRAQLTARLVADGGRARAVALRGVRSVACTRPAAAALVVTAAVARVQGADVGLGRGGLAGALAATLAATLDAVWW